MSIAPITDSQRKAVEKGVGYDAMEMKNKVVQIKEWMKMQPYMPCIPDSLADKLIHSFLTGTKMSPEKAKQKLDTYFSSRHQLSEIFLNRDPTQQFVRDSVDRLRYFPLSELTHDGIRVHIVSYNPEKKLRFTGKDIEGLHFRIMAIQAALINQGDFNQGIYFVEDCRGFQISHITEVPWPFALRSISFCQEGLPIRVKGIILISTPEYREAVMKIVKPVLSEKVRNRIHVFKGDHTNLYKFIPQRILPSDYGGEAPSIEESSRAWQKSIESMRDFLLEDQNYKTVESKRPRNIFSSTGQVFGLNGTFNKLNID